MKCPNCHEEGPHFVGPSFGEEGIYICKKAMTTLHERAEQLYRKVCDDGMNGGTDESAIAAIADTLQAREADTFEAVAKLYLDWCAGKWFDAMTFDQACKDKAAAIRAGSAGGTP